MLLSKTAKVKIGHQNIKHYKNLGYESINYGDKIEVDITHVPKHSETKVLVECDFCKENIITMTYDRYNTTMDKSGTCACKDCVPIKTRETVRRKYNVDHVAQLESVKNKKKETCLARYNAECAMQNSDIQKSIRENMMKKYGVEYYSQTLELKEKRAQSFYSNGTAPTSRQQLYIYELYNMNGEAEINYPISKYNVDICFLKEKLIVEIDFGGHNLEVKFGCVTQDEFDQKEIIRNNIIKRRGYKMMRIISSKDYLPSDEILLQMLSQAKEYFSNYPEHSWIEFNIDTSTVRNAEHKDGVFFNYGEIRKIKSSEVA